MEVKMNEKVEQLSGTMAVEILRTVARKWLENRGVEAFVVIDNIRRAIVFSHI